MEELFVLVKPGSPLPQPKERLQTSSLLTGQAYGIKVHSITELRWNKAGDLIVGVRGKRVVDIH